MNPKQPQFPLGPFQQKNFDQAFWNNISEKLMLLENFPKQKILPEYHIFLQLLREVNSSPDYNEYFGITSVKEFFLGSFLPAATMSLVDCRSLIDNDLKELINECLHQLVFLSLKSLKEDFHSSLRILYRILDPFRLYYHPNKGLVLPKSDMIVDDKNDTDQKPIFAVVREDPISSTQIVQLINSFGEKGGFSSLLERIYDTKNIMPASRMSILCNMIANICPLLHRDFVREYVLKLEEAVCINLAHNTESDISSVQDNVIQSFTVMLTRISPIEKDQMVNRFKSKISQKELSACSLRKNQISTNDLQELLNKNSLTSEELELLWEKITDGDKQVKQSIYNSLSKRWSTLSNQHVKYILSKLNETPLKEITDQDISLVKAFLRQPPNCDFPSKEHWDFYWRMAPANKEVHNSKDMSGNIAFSDYFTKITMRAHDFKKEILNIIDQCLENIKNKVLVKPSYEQIKLLIEHFREYSQHPDNLTKGKCIIYLCKERCLLHQLLDDIKEEKERLSKHTLNTQEIETSLSNIKHRLDFAISLLNIVKTQINIFTSDVLGNFLDLTVNNVTVPNERQLGFDFFEKIGSLNSEFCISVEDLVNFCREKVHYRDFLRYGELDHNGFLCFKNLFIMVNKRLTYLTQLAPLVDSRPQKIDSSLKNQKFETNCSLKVSPDQLEGIKDLWELALDDKGYSVLSSLLIKIYMHPNVLSNRQSFLNICHKIIKETAGTINNEKSKRRILKCLSLIRDAVKESEIEGFAHLKSHIGLTEGETLTLKIWFKFRSSYETTKEFCVDSNKSVFDLCLLVAKEFHIQWNQLSPLQQRDTSFEISSKDTAKTLQEAGFLARQTLTVKEIAIPLYYEENFLGGKNCTTLNPKAKKIFIEWFEEFSDNNKMSPEQYGRFLSKKFNYLYGDYRPNDSRIVKVFFDYDEDRDSYLSLEEFLKVNKFNYNAWRHFELCKYRKDFKKINSLGQIEVNLKSLPRYLLSANNEHFQLLYSLLDSEDEEIATQAWDLISTLPTNVQILEDVVMLKGVRNTPISQAKKNMGILFNPKLPKKFLYSLHTAIILIQNTFKDAKNSDKEEFIKEFLWSQNHKLKDYWQSWQTDFFNHDGLTHLIEILKILSINDTKRQTTIKCLILKITASYFPVKPISNANDINRVPCLKKLLNLLVKFGLDYIREKELVASQCEYSAALQIEIQSLPIDKEQEVQALQIMSRINFRDLLEETINLCLPALTKDEAKIDSEDLIIFGASISVLRTLVLYVERINL